MKLRKKLIEVALPLDAINKASAHEKMPGIGPHPRGLHLWWARRPLAAARAVIFSQMVDDPSEYVDTLKMDDKLRRRAENDLKKRHKVWEEQTPVKEKADAAGIESPDPGPEPNLDEIIAEHERDRLFKIIEELVLWENTTNETVLDKARAEIWQSWRRTCADNADHPQAKELFDRNKLPAFHDPFAGGGALPLEAQRLGLEAYASDLNPVAVLINKAMIEIPPKFAGREPVNPEWQSRRPAEKAMRVWKDAEGLADDVRYYGKWMRDEAEKRIGHFYPKVKAVQEKDGSWRHATPEEIEYAIRNPKSAIKALTVIAWIWARTVKSPNPAFRDVDVPLASTFMLSTKAGKEAYVEPIIENGGYRFEVRNGKPNDGDAAKLGTTAGKRQAFRCLMSNVPLTYDYIRTEGKAGRMSSKLMAIVAEGERGRVYLSPTNEQEELAALPKPEWKPESALPNNPRDFKTPNYGLPTFGDLFTSRQLVALTTFSDLVGEAMQRIEKDALAAAAAASAGGISKSDRASAKSATVFAKPADGIGKSKHGFAKSHETIAANTDGTGENPQAHAITNIAHTASDLSLREGGTGLQAYAEAVGVYLAFVVDRCADFSNSCTRWVPGNQKVMNLFGKQAIAMTWDYPEAAILHDTVGGFLPATKFIAECIGKLPQQGIGIAEQQDASKNITSQEKVISTDPPYYDNIGYADLSDFFYVWQRRALKSIFPEILSTLVVPKAEELIASPYRHGGRERAEQFFLDGMTRVMRELAKQGRADFPVTVYYAFKQSETESDSGTASTGWETFLDAVFQAGFSIRGTWPMRSEQQYRMIGIGTNALASSIVLVCRRRPENAPTVTRREFVNALKSELPKALRHLQRGNIAPVDLAQAAIGPGMAVFTRYQKVLDAEGDKLSVSEALALINQTLDEVLAEQEGDFDADTRWALVWFEENGFERGEFGRAEQLSKAKNTSISEMADPKTSPILEAKGGKVRLFRPAELEEDWSPESDGRLTIWDMVHQLIRVLEKNGETAAAGIVKKLGAKAETARELCYRLYTICERKKRANDALSYNALVQSWPEIVRLAAEQATSTGGEEQILPGM